MKIKRIKNWRYPTFLPFVVKAISYQDFAYFYGKYTRCLVFLWWGFYYRPRGN